MSDQLPPGNANVVEPVFEDGAPRCENTCAHHFPVLLADGHGAVDGCRVMDYEVQYSCICEPAVTRLARAIRDIEAILGKDGVPYGLEGDAIDAIEKVIDKLREEIRYV